MRENSCSEPRLRKSRLEFPRHDFVNYQFVVTIFAAAVATIIIGLFGAVDKPTLNLASQSLIAMAAFLAGASIVMTSFYMGQVLKGVPEMANKLIPSLEGVADKMAPELLPRLRNIEGKSAAEFWKILLESFASAFKDGWEDWSKALDALMSFPKMLREAGSRIIYFLVVSTFFSVLTILSGSIFLLGLSFACVIIAVATLLKSWKIAEGGIAGFVFLSSFVKFLEDMIAEGKKK